MARRCRISGRISPNQRAEIHGINLASTLGAVSLKTPGGPGPTTRFVLVRESVHRLGSAQNCTEMLTKLVGKPHGHGIPDLSVFG